MTCIVVVLTSLVIAAAASQAAYAVAHLADTRLQGQLRAHPATTLSRIRLGWFAERSSGSNTRMSRSVDVDVLLLKPLSAVHASECLIEFVGGVGNFGGECAGQVCGALCAVDGFEFREDVHLVGNTHGCSSRAGRGPKPPEIAQWLRLP